MPEYLSASCQPACIAGWCLFRLVLAQAFFGSTARRGVSFYWASLTKLGDARPAVPPEGPRSVRDCRFFPCRFRNHLPPCAITWADYGSTDRVRAKPSGGRWRAA